MPNAARWLASVGSQIWSSAMVNVDDELGSWFILLCTFRRIGDFETPDSLGLKIVAKLDIRNRPGINRTDKLGFSVIRTSEIIASGLQFGEFCRVERD